MHQPHSWKSIAGKRIFWQEQPLFIHQTPISIMKWFLEIESILMYKSWINFCLWGYDCLKPGERQKNWFPTSGFLHFVSADPSTEKHSHLCTLTQGWSSSRWEGHSHWCEPIFGRNTPWGMGKEENTRRIIQINGMTNITGHLQPAPGSPLNLSFSLRSLSSPHRTSLSAFWWQGLYNTQHIAFQTVEVHKMFSESTNDL